MASKGRTKSSTEDSAKNNTRPGSRNRTDHKDTASANKKSKEICLDCNLKCDIEKTLECDLCLRWYHPTCQNVEDDMFKVLLRDSKSNAPLLKWYCNPICRNLSNDFLEGFLSLKKDVDVLKSNVQEVNTKVTRLEHGDFTADMERKITDIADASQTAAKVTDIARGVFTREMTETVNEIVNSSGIVGAFGGEPQVDPEGLLSIVDEKNKANNIEMEERICRKSNLIVFGIPEPKSKNRLERYAEDKTTAEKITQETNCIIAPKETRRLGRYNETKIRPLKIIFRNQTERDEVLGNIIKIRKEAKNEDQNKLCMKMTGVTRDMTPLEQKEDAKLFADWKAKKDASKNDPHAKWIRRDGKVINVGRYPKDVEETEEEEEGEEEEEEEGEETD